MPDHGAGDTMKLAISHVTRYRFAEPVSYGLKRLRLTPKPTQGQQLLDWRMEFAGAKLEVEYDDHNHNRVSLVSITAGTELVEIACHGTVATSDHAGVIGHHSGHMPLWAFLQPTPLTRPGHRLRALFAKLGVRPGLPADAVLPTLHRLSERVLTEIAYLPGETEVTTSAEEAAALGRGVCQDHAHVFIAMARMLGVPARYVAGYLMMDDRVEQDAGHAWAEAHVAGLGWVGFDVSNAISPDARYVRVATGRDYTEAAPIAGISLGGGQTQLAVELAVEQQRNEQ